MLITSKWAKNLNTFLSKWQYLGLKLGADLGLDFPWINLIAFLIINYELP